MTANQSQIQENMSMMLLENFSTLQLSQIQILDSLKNPEQINQNFVIFNNLVENNALYINVLNFGKFKYSSLEIVHEELDGSFEYLGGYILNDFLFFMGRSDVRSKNLESMSDGSKNEAGGKEIKLFMLNLNFLSVEFLLGSKFGESYS